MELDNISLVYYSQTCFNDTCLQRPHFVVSFENGFSLKHVLKEPVYKDHFLCFPWAVAIGRFDCISCTVPMILPRSVILFHVFVNFLYENVFFFLCEIELKLIMF